MINKVHLHGNILSAKNGAVKMKVSHGWGGGEVTDKELVPKYKECLKPIN